MRHNNSAIIGEKQSYATKQFLGYKFPSFIVVFSYSWPKMYDGGLSELIFIRIGYWCRMVLKSKYLDLSCWQQRGRIRRKKNELILEFYLRMGIISKCIMRQQ